MIYYIAATIVSVVSLAAGIYLGVANTDAAIKSEYVPMLYTGSGFLISIVAIMLADKFSASENNKKNVEAIKENLLSSIPSTMAFRRFESADSAIKQIISQMPRAKECWNTRMSPAGIDIGPERLVNFEKCVLRCIKEGLAYHDVATSNHIEYINRLIQSSKSSRGRYTCAVIEPGFVVINFIIVKFDDNAFDIYFGWPVGMSSGAEKSVFLSRDMRLIDYFIDYHEMLTRVGHNR